MYRFNLDLQLYFQVSSFIALMNNRLLHVKSIFKNKQQLKILKIKTTDFR